MRLFLLLMTVGLLADAATIDEATAEWVLGIVCSNSTDANFGEEDAPPPCKTEEKKKFDLTPTKIGNVVECTTRDNHPGVCVLYYQCDIKSRTIIDDGATILDVRSTECSHYLEVCCRPKDMINEKMTEEPPIFRPEDDERSESPDPIPDRHKDDQPAPVTTKRPTKPNQRTIQCGWSNPGVNIFKLRSKEAEEKSLYADFGEFPYMVAIMKKSGDDDVWSQADYLGGGTLIHPSVVMTVAHKLTVKKKKLEPDQLKCRAGEWDTQTELELYAHQDRDVAKYIVHEDYYRTSLYNDIALLIMRTPFELKNAWHMGTGCLGTALPPDEYKCFSMGWGSEFREKKKYAVILKKVLLNIVEHDRCQQMLRTNSRLGELFDLHESLTCANGAEGVDTCRGDGGSPLVCAVSNKPGENRFAVYGMVAYGITCGDPLIPGIYVNVPHLKSWVDKKMQEENLDTQYYTV